MTNRKGRISTKISIYIVTVHGFSSRDLFDTLVYLAWRLRLAVPIVPSKCIYTDIIVL